MKDKMKQIAERIDSSETVLIIQAENPDGDSLGSAIALEQILMELGKETHMYCPVQIPGYLRYMQGWSRVSNEIPAEFDLSIIVDTSSAILLERALEGGNGANIGARDIIVLDHHDSKNDIPYDTIELNDDSCVAAAEVIYYLAQESKWKINQEAKESIAAGILADSLGLMSEATTARTIMTIAELVEGGVRLDRIDEKRRQYSKKSEEIFRYKGQLFERVEFHLDGKLGIVIIPWEDIEKYSDAYNPAMLILDEMRMVDGVQLAAAFKLYPDGKITCKMRANSGSLHANRVAEEFGGGGHPYAAGFKVRDRDFVKLKSEFINVVKRLIEDNES